MSEIERTRKALHEEEAENARLKELLRHSLEIINDLRGFREQKHYDNADTFQSSVLKELK